MLLGKLYLDRSLSGRLSPYHLEVGIAYEHCKAKPFKETNWTTILAHYDVLFTMTGDPVVALNRALIVLEVKGHTLAIEEIEALSTCKALQTYYVYHAAVGEIFLRAQQLKRAKNHLKKAHDYCTSSFKKNYLAKKIEELSALSE